MIEEISIRDLGVIAEATLPLGPGFTALTGETGAGKTMVVTALGLLLGERADSGAVRMGSAQAWIEGHWNVDEAGPVAERVREAGGALDDIGQQRAELVLGRSVSAEGRSRAVIGGRSAPVSVLSELADRLVVVHGQSDQVRLRSQPTQRVALDDFAGERLAKALFEYSQVFRRWKSNQEELDELVLDRDRRAAEAQDLREAMAEIEEIDPQPGEDEALVERAERLTNSEELRAAAAEAREFLSSEDLDGTDTVALIETARRRLERASEHDAELGTIAESLVEASFLISETAGQLSSYLASIDADSARELELVNERRAQLTTVMRKYGPTLADVIDQLESGSARLFDLDGDSERIDQLQRDLDADGAQVEALATTLTTERAAAAARLSDAVTGELAALAMPHAKFTVEISERDDYSSVGRDQIMFLLQPHSGSEARPLGRGASGGELSRVMLAIEVVLAGKDPVPTFVFDEIDAGVGGAAAIEIGRRLATLAERAQVIVVTHLAQVAAFATNHLSVVKDSDGSVTASSVQQLRGEERVAEMTRLLSGLPGSESGLEHARELLERAGSQT